MDKKKESPLEIAIIIFWAIAVSTALFTALALLGSLIGEAKGEYGMSMEEFNERSQNVRHEALGTAFLLGAIATVSGAIYWILTQILKRTKS